MENGDNIYATDVLYPLAECQEFGRKQTKRFVDLSNKNWS